MKKATGGSYTFVADVGCGTLLEDGLYSLVRVFLILLGCYLFHPRSLNSFLMS